MNSFGTNLSVAATALSVALLAGWPAKGSAAVPIVLPEQQVCDMIGAAVVATVVSKQSRMQSTAIGDMIVTDVQLDVDAVLKGPVGASLEITVSGGRIGDQALHVSGSPRYAEGDKVLLLLALGPGSSELMGSKGIRYAFTLDPAVPLPSEAVLQAVWQEHCGPPVSGGGNPTAPLLPLLPAEFVDWCEHY